MTDATDERLVSASEVERWSYCPLSWKLDREGVGDGSPVLVNGESLHEEVAGHARGSIRMARSAKDARTTTWAFLAISAVLLGLGMVLASITSVRFMDVSTWRSLVVLVSALIVGISVAIYFRSIAKERSVLGSLMTSADMADVRARIGRSFEPILLFIFGAYLSVNGVLLLRPFGLSVGYISTAMTVSLLILYVFLLGFLLVFLRSGEHRLRRGRLSIISSLSMGLMVSLSVLFLFLTERYPRWRDFGYVLLVMSFLWFIGSLVYSLVLRIGRSHKVRAGNGKELPMVVLSIIASVFASSAFIAGGRDLRGYYLITIVLSAFWLVGAAFFFVKGMASSARARVSAELAGVERDRRILQADTLKGEGRGKPLVSRKHFLVGAPDMVIEVEGLKVPLEIKSGKAPPRPHFSHVMQVVCYMILLDENYGQITPYGYIDHRPPGGARQRFTVERDMVTRAMALSKVSEIREACHTGEAHRNHDRPGKCRNCSRRSGCPERLA